MFTPLYNNIFVDTLTKENYNKQIEEKNKTLKFCIIKKQITQFDVKHTTFPYPENQLSFEEFIKLHNLQEAYNCKKRKIVINTAPNIFSISKKACEYLAKKGMPAAIESLSCNDTDSNRFYLSDLDSDIFIRTNQDLIEIIEILKDEANSDISKLKIIEIPDDIEFELHCDSESLGEEWIAEKHRTWR